MKRLPLALLAAGCVFATHALAAKPILTIDGSSTVYPITEAVAEEFQLKYKEQRITVGISGTGGGFKKFCKGETDISNASRPISEKEMAACREHGVTYYELPIAYDALTVVVNPKNDWASSITVAELKKIWEPSAQEKIMTWSQVRADWPDKPLTLYGAGSDSGTFDYFSEAIVGKAKAQRGDYTASEDDNVLVQGISKDMNALGYLPYSYYSSNKNLLKSVAVDAGKGAVMPAHEAIISGTYSPLARPLFVYINAASAKRQDVKNLVDFYLTEGIPLIEEVKYVPLPATSYKMLLEEFGGPKTGTRFAGHALIGVHMDEIMKRTPVN